MPSRKLMLVIGGLLMAAFSAAQNTTSGPSGYSPGLDVTALDKRADPCVDFYQFACGGWLQSNPIPADQAAWGVDSKLQEQNRLILRQILEAASRPDRKRSAIDQKIGDYYAACMDESAIEAAGSKPLQKDLEQIADLKSVGELQRLVDRRRAVQRGLGERRKRRPQRGRAQAA